MYFIYLNQTIITFKDVILTQATYVLGTQNTYAN